VIDRAYFQPADLEAALSILAKHREAGIVAGGTDLVVGARSSDKTLPATVVAIDRLKELGRIETSGDGGLQIGALATHADLETSTVVQGSWSALSDAASLVGSPATRHIGTIGGNICNASPAMETGSPLLVFEAIIELASKRGLRRIPIGAFLTGPRKTARRSDELLKSIVLPPLPRPGVTGSAYVRLEYRQAMEIAIVGAAALVTLRDDGICTEARIALTAVAPTCVRASPAEKVLIGSTVDADLVAKAARSAVGQANPIDDVRASAQYRRAMVPVIVERALRLAWNRAKDGVSK
jgi:CO/xanthine dehydrogenase FAD-binding subunit